MTRRTRAGALAVVACVAAASVVLAGAAAAFSPPRGASSTAPARDAGPKTALGGPISVAPGPSRGGRTRLAYKYLPNDGAEHWGAGGARNETAAGDAGRAGAGATVRAEGRREVVRFDDLGDGPAAFESRGSFNAGALGPSSYDESDGDVANREGEDLARELEGVVREKGFRINDDETIDPPKEKATPLRAVEPSEAKPSQKFASPIHLIKKVPRVEPVANSTVFFLRMQGDPAWPAPAGEASEDAPAPAVESWKTAMSQQRGASFMATSYLEAIGTDANAKKDDDVDSEGGEDDLLKSLREQQAQLQNERSKSRQEAIYEASRRTSPQEAIDKRIEEGERERKRKEREMLEKLYVERKERLDAKRSEEERHGEARQEQRAIREGKAQERTAAAGEGAEEGVGEAEEEAPVQPRREVPVLDRSCVDAAPLLIGSTLTLPYEGLRPFQRRAIEVARKRHEEHCRRAEAGGEGDRGGIHTAPLIAVTDGYTAAASEALQASRRPNAKRRYATLAAVDIVEGDGGNPSAVALFGVGRAFLRDHFSSEDEGPMPEEAGLNKRLARIRETDRQASDDNHEFPVVVAEYDPVPDGDGEAGHAVDALDRRANCVYRLHEERKKLLEGLRAGEARLRRGRWGLGRKASVLDEACLIELLDGCDGLGGLLLLGTVLDDGASDEEPSGTIAPPAGDAAPPPRSRLEALENYGLGSYGATSTVPDLARRLAAALEPYSAPDRRGREEREAEAASYAALLSLAAYAGPGEMAEALVTTASAAGRLERASALMERHRDELRGLVEVVSRELAECGEECTDLW